jgi:hypothetical protein
LIGRVRILAVHVAAGEEASDYEMVGEGLKFKPFKGGGGGLKWLELP